MKTLQVFIYGLLGLNVSCVEAPDHYYGARPENIFAVYSDSVGVYPNDDVMVDPNNPVALVPIGDCPNVPIGQTPVKACAETKWIVEANTDGTGSPVLSFYIWATWLVREPTGEHQFYAAENLRKIYENGLASQIDLPRVRTIAIAAYQAVLDNFFESVSYDESGLYAYPLAPLAFEAIQGLGATPSGFRLDGDRVVRQ